MANRGTSGIDHSFIRGQKSRAHLHRVDLDESSEDGEGELDFLPNWQSLGPSRTPTPRGEYKYVNMVYKGYVGHIGMPLFSTIKKLNLLDNIKIKDRYDPKMLISKRQNITIIIFQTGSFRVMGAFKPSEANAREALAIVLRTDESRNKKQFSALMRTNLDLQSVTITFKLPVQGIKLISMSRILDADRTEHTFDKNIFPAIGLDTPDGHVNIFYSGNIVVTGKTYKRDQLDDIYNRLLGFINDNNLEGEYIGPSWIRR